MLAARQGWVDRPTSVYLHLWGGLGPLVAAVVVTAALRGRRGLRDLWRQTVAWRGRGGWLALAALGPAALFLTVVVLARVLEGAWPDLGRFGASEEYPALPLGIYWLANLVFYGYGEEVGWRGFAQPHLQARMSALRAAALVSLIWAGWHLPLFGITAGYRQMGPAEILGWYLALLVGTFLLAWLYHRSRASILVVAAFHAMLDITINTPTGSTLIPALMSVVLLVVGVAAVPLLRRIRLHTLTSMQ
jgi:membrane protease YdiL (CAAX protease family)